MQPKSIAIPDDFPREPPVGSVSGVQPKILVRLIDGKYVSGRTEEEIAERFDNCRDLVDQLFVYCKRKLSESPELLIDALLPKVKNAVIEKSWDVTAAELNWIMSKLFNRLSEDLPVQERRPLDSD
ncbi:hypothetical protein LNV09_00510 [Paucibacter sp. B2R-40]|uniref:hypothetical protein n=1 Tax=Paucibacter sp. B2R-40 TaxID=2893554 RepID=UPI0021E46775|nr:hypothetical protein [Paucibacter sp. B2R-40]MCV2352634.1 hypothetical protein [Paucibacter sp. B2R-40]